MTKSDQLQQILKNIASFRDGFSRGNSPSESAVEVKFTNIWLDSIVYGYLNGMRNASMEDGHALIQFMISHESNSFTDL